MLLLRKARVLKRQCFQPYTEGQICGSFGTWNYMIPVFHVTVIMVSYLLTLTWYSNSNRHRSQIVWWQRKDRNKQGAQMGVGNGAHFCLSKNSFKSMGACVEKKWWWHMIDVYSWLYHWMSSISGLIWIYTNSHFPSKMRRTNFTSFLSFPNECWAYVNN